MVASFFNVGLAATDLSLAVTGLAVAWVSLFADLLIVADSSLCCAVELSVAAPVAGAVAGAVLSAGASLIVAVEGLSASFFSTLIMIVFNFFVNLPFLLYFYDI